MELQSPSGSKTSYHRILKNTSIIGGASFLNIVIGLIRTKVLAVLLGPFGVGLAGLYLGFLTTGGTFATMGVGTIGTRQIADAFSADDKHALHVVRRAMFWGTMLLAGSAALLIWLFRNFLAKIVLGSTANASAIGWLSLGVALMVAGFSQSALLQGMYRVADFARVTVFSSVLYTAVGVGLLWWLGVRGLVAYVLLGPIMTFLFGHFYVARLPKYEATEINWQELAKEWVHLLRLGTAYVGAGIAVSVVQLWIRIDLEHVLGTDAVGQYQAAWTISAQYLAFILNAMASDFYPRLTGVIRDHEAAGRLVNQQTEVALLLSTPVFIGMMAAAPWVMHLLYAPGFAPGAVLLRWQVLGDVLKVASWPLAFVMLSAGDIKTYFWAEWITNLLTAGLIGGLLPIMGLRITGIAYLITYLFYLPLVYFIARRRIGFRWTPAVVRLIVIAFAAGTAVWLIAAIRPWCALIGCVVAVAYGVFSVGRISHMSGLGGKLGTIGAMARRLTSTIKT